MSDSERDTGEDGTLRLRAYLPLVASLWFAAGCHCGQMATISVRRAIRLTGSDAATVGELGRRLRCWACGRRSVGVTIAPDTRSPGEREREGPAAETRDE
jgi:hypothetical protein